MKRHLTIQERNEIIQAVLDEFTTINNLPKNMKSKFHQDFTEMLEIPLSKVEIYPDGIPLLKNKIIKKYRLVNPAKSVGIICGQSIGEMQTQTTLNTFHQAGLANRVVVAGVPRFLEIIDTNRSETQSTPVSSIFFKNPLKLVNEVRDQVNHSLIYHNFGNLIQSHNIEKNPTLEKWYDVWIKHKNFNPGHIRLRYHMNLNLLYRYKISLGFIVDKLLEHVNYLLTFSPLHLGIIDFWFSDVEMREDFIEDKIHKVLINYHICGIEKIQNIFFMKQNTEWYIETDGSNLEEVMKLPYVDIFRTYSNDIWEIYNLFGIEAVRSYIVEELTNLMPTIHQSHITLLADRMTVSGRLRSISRYTRKNENSSILSKATFEETLSGFLRSAIMNEKDTVVGASASIICGKTPKVGTGLCDLLIQ